MNLYDNIVDMVFDEANKLGLNQVEAYVEDGQSLGIKINKQDFESFDFHQNRGLGIRVLLDGSFGYAYSENIEADAVKKTVLQARDNAKLAKPKDTNVLPGKDDVEHKMNLYNEELEKVDVEKKIQFAKDMEKLTLDSDELIFNCPWAAYSEGGGMSRVVNSNGVDRAYRSNLAFAYVAALAKKGEEVKDGMEIKVSRNFGDFSAEAIAKGCSEKTLAKLGADSPKSGKYFVAFQPKSMISMLGVFSSIFSAKNVQMGKSLLAGKLGKKICGEGVTIIDDALMPNGFVSRPYDSEGVSSKTLELLVDGELKSYLHNSSTAKQDGTVSTGHGARGGFKGSLDIAPSNFYIKNGSIPASDIYSSEDTIIEIEDLQGLHGGCNPISGDFSASATGFMLKNGERVGSLHNFTVSGNFLTMLDSVVSIGNDLEFYFPHGSSCFGSPTVLVKDLSIAGK